MFSTILLQLIVFFLPTQLGLHFWPDFSRAAGIKVDYLSPTLYFTDLLILLFVSFNLKPIIAWLRSYFRPVSFFLMFITINIFFGISPANSFFWWLRLLLYLLFFLLLRLRKVTWQRVQKTLIFSVLLVIVLEVLQSVYQSSLGGLFYWLGERTFTSSSSGLARLSFYGLDYVRPPSTFSHPNSLAGYLLVVYYLLHLNKSPFWIRLTTFFGLLITFSKGSLLAFLLVIILGLNPLILINISLAFSFLQLFLPDFLSGFRFVSDRQFLLRPSKTIIFSLPFLGVGLGNFVSSLVPHLPGSFLVAEKLQPVHNLPLLYLAETGFAGLAVAVIIIRQNISKILKPAFLGFLALLLITGTFDHYWWTLPQNKLIILLAGAILL